MGEQVGFRLRSGLWSVAIILDDRLKPSDRNGRFHVLYLARLGKAVWHRSREVVRRCSNPPEMETHLNYVPYLAS